MALGLANPGAFHRFALAKALKSDCTPTPGARTLALFRSFDGLS